MSLYTIDALLDEAFELADKGAITWQQCLSRTKVEFEISHLEFLQTATAILGIKWKSGRLPQDLDAMYNRTLDEITSRHPAFYTDFSTFRTTIFHEIAHAIGSHHRLGDTLSSVNTTREEEECIAELFAHINCFLLGWSTLSQRTSSLAYIAMNVLFTRMTNKDLPKEVFKYKVKEEVEKRFRYFEEKVLVNKDLFLGESI